MFLREALANMSIEVPSVIPSLDARIPEILQARDELIQLENDNKSLDNQISELRVELANLEEYIKSLSSVSSSSQVSAPIVEMYIQELERKRDELLDKIKNP